MRHYGADDRAKKGVIIFKVGIHGFPVNLPIDYYHALNQGAISKYAYTNMDNKDRYYYKRVYMGCVRAIDFIFTLPKFDGKNIGLYGRSQGGALSIVTTALDSRVKALVSIYPALCDTTGYLNGRVGGWPHMFKEVDPRLKDIWAETASYYDVVNFAKKLQVPGYYTWGYNDVVCPPTTTFSAYNSISAEKQLHLYKETGHWMFPEQQTTTFDWLMEQLKN